MFSNSANLMMSAMMTPMDTMFEGQALGPPEAFYPFVTVNVDGTVHRDLPDMPSSPLEDDDIEDDDLFLNMIDFGDDTSDDDLPIDEEMDSSASPPDISSTPVRPTTATSEDQVHPLLSHLDKGLVGAFRRNQTRHQLLTRNAASRESLAFSSPYSQGTLRGIKRERLGAANTPITPMRKRKTPKADPATSPSPMNGHAADKNKRKFSGEQRGHKRSKSMN